jgi:integrase
MVADLSQWLTLHKGSRWVFPSESGSVNGHLVRDLKDLALKHGLNCGHCLNKEGKSCAKHAVCDRWLLHKFRRSFATRVVAGGVPLNVVSKQLLGHSDLSTTERYLASANHVEKTTAPLQQVFARFTPKAKQAVAI